MSFQKHCLRKLDQMNSWGNVKLSCLPTTKNKFLSKAKYSSSLSIKESIICWISKLLILILKLC